MSDKIERNNEAMDDMNDRPTWNLNDSPQKIIGQIGPYRLLNILGEGGFSIVYLAEQDKPVKRRVALKVIKPGMDTKQVIARFEAERQALALLEHPNIAPVFDAGTTEAGLPYFVMENIKGTPITEHCDRHKLTIEGRLELFLQVCEAVQYAHQKGIIHRDIKPSNILISLEGQKATPKIIDFGVAKAITQPLTERTLYTEQGQFIGTPEYMSPEQAQMGAQDIDTRSDVYSLGVLLYELLAGTLPFETKTLREGGIDHIRQVIRDQEPLKPGTRLMSLGEKTRKIAASRSTDIANLSRCLDKELEWIPLMALRKDRTRRYRSASELADDIRNYLDGVPLIAGPESTVYRLRKSVRRNKTLVTGIAAVSAVLIAGIIISTLFAVKAARARHEEHLALNEAERQMKISKTVGDFLRNDLLASVDPYVAQGREVTVRSFLDAASNKLEGKFENEPLVEASIRYTLGNTYRNIGEFSPAQEHLEHAYRIQSEQLGMDNPETLSTMEALAGVYWRQARYDKAEELYNKTVQGRKKILGPQDPNTLYSMNGLAVLYFSQGRYREANSLYEEMLDISSTVLGQEDVTTILFRGNLATVYRFLGLYQQAEDMYLKAIEQARRVFGDEHPDTLYSINGLGMLYLAEGRYTEAEGKLLEAYEYECIVLGREHTETLNSMNGLGMVYIAQGRYDDANDILNDAYNYSRSELGQGHPTTLTSMNCLALLYKETGRYSESESMFMVTLEGRKYVLGDQHPDTLDTMHNLAGLYVAADRYDEAEKLLIETIESRNKVLGERHPNTLESVNGLIDLYQKWGKHEQARQWKEKLQPGVSTSLSN